MSRATRPKLRAEHWIELEPRDVDTPLSTLGEQQAAGTGALVCTDAGRAAAHASC